MLRRFCQGQNLHNLFSKQQIPECIHDLIPTFATAFGDKNLGTLLNDSFAFTQSAQEEVLPFSKDISDLSDDVYSLLQEWVAEHDPEASDVRRLCPGAVVHTTFERQGETYEIATKSLGRSAIIYKSSSADWSAGRIRAMFSHTRKCRSDNVTDMFLLIDPYVPLSAEDAAFDHYRGFPHCSGGRLFYQRFTPQPILLRKQDILCHFGGIQNVAVAGIEEACIWALPLNKVPI
jgi:hypothetical protein